MSKTATPSYELLAKEGFAISAIIKKAWALFKKEWITIYAVQLVPFIVGLAYNYYYSFIEPEMIAPVALAYLLFQFVASLLVIKALILVVRGKKVDAQVFENILPVTAKYIGLIFLYMLIILGGFLLLILPGIYFMLMFMFAPYLVIDKNMGPIEALKASKKITKGIKWDIIGFSAAMVVLMYSGIFALLVGLIITIPLSTIAYIVFYDRVAARLEAKS